MSEGWNIAILGATGAVAKPCSIRWLNASSRSVKSMRWHVMKVLVNTCVLTVNRSLFRMSLTLTGPRLSWHFLSRELKQPLHGWRKQPMPVVW